MNDTSNSNSKKFSNIALVFFIAGIILPVLIITIAIAFFDKDISELWPVMILLYACELLALVFGILGWKEKTGKVAVIGFGVLFCLFIVSVIIKLCCGEGP